MLTNGEIGTDPPLVLFKTGFTSNVFIKVLDSQFPKLLSISVLNAGYETLELNLCRTCRDFFGAQNDFPRAVYQPPQLSKSRGKFCTTLK